MTTAVMLCAARALRPLSWIPGICQTQTRHTHQRASLLSFWELIPMRAEPLRKKKKVDPRKDQAAKDRLKRRIRKLERANQELIPIEDFITPLRFLDKSRKRPQEEHSFEESEQRALLLKRWALYKKQEHEAERDAIRAMLEAQQEALQELKLESPELYEEAIKRDPSLFPFEKEGPHHTPPISNYQAPEGRYNDITKVYAQVESKR
ncbi:39S ribosomal protein L40, mitochondrial [Cricetulus griseus]|uniref:Large ribosomal subunit protein mL40 n=1 Tax=Cricetulus griseus TaxID=10029 RepID=G3HEN4_CRIGR|nr:39S ribosomal protein L40, mitochondrial [Cricetulus griseus]XP_027268907.1 39S ribosomal protein L40, mitochondrial [Cricetulus griseus]EGV97581.1 39S ribosomal protein L40, mitochondrial [Cricetulus griseus]ERE76195.1 39S ribosomal protein L40 [Cricetulus griseus]